jgi:hypothetical protein
MRQQQRIRTCPCCGERSFGAGVAAADNHDIETGRKKHFWVCCSAVRGGEFYVRGLKIHSFSRMPCRFKQSKVSCSGSEQTNLPHARSRPSRHAACRAALTQQKKGFDC